MATDYDAPRKRDDEEDVGAAASIEELQGKGREPSSPQVDVDEDDLAETFELPGADLSDEQLAVRVVPIQEDEFTCSSCFLVKHRSQLAQVDPPLCTECAS